MFKTSPTFRQLYDQANHMKQEREAEQLRLKLPSPGISKEINDLTSIMNLLVVAFRKAVPEGVGQKSR